MPLELSQQARQRIAAVRARYPEAQAACLPALWIAQDELGYVPDEAVALVARELGLPEAHVFGVVTFYTMYLRHKPGKFLIQLCTNVSCWANGAYNLLEHLEQRLGIKRGETTKDGLFTLLEVECLAACGQAPMMLVNDVYYYDLTRDKVNAILDELRVRGTGHA
jgi:NADH-quinone oxidoreductase subunit E